MKQMTGPTPQWGKWLGGAVAGAALMYMLDPERGGARRTQSGGKILDLTRQTGSTLSNAMRSLGSTVGGTVEGVSQKLGGAVEGIANTAAQAEPAARPNGAAGQAASQTMQEATQAAGGSASRMRSDWAPGMRGAAVLGGGLLGLFGLLRRSPIGATLGMAGLALLVRGATNQSFKNMITGKALTQTIDLEKSIRIDASPEQVYDFWTNYENFPRFMSQVVEVRDLGGRRSHWVVKGPAGSEFEWDAITTEQSRPNRLAWRSEPGAEIAQSGSVQFEPERGGTRVTVRMSYCPPAGALGHGIAKLLGADPKSRMGENLARMKAFIERGEIPYDAARAAASAPGKFLH